jgi:D-arabinose 1-dehydrogenase-like Zn-dependent alcohol dehydrogenase
MGTRDELESMIELMDRTGVRPQIAAEMSMDDALDAFVAMSTGDVVGKLVLTR